MLAYLVGGPQDMIKIHVDEDWEDITMPHIAAMARLAPRAFQANPYPDTIVTDARYVKIYESRETATPRFAVFVYQPVVDPRVSL